MTRRTQEAYHTCKLDNGFQFIRSKIPFISGNQPKQWLTQGYYFWTDSIYWAKKWRQEGSRAIAKFNIDLCFDTEVLDLVGNVKHQEEFIALIRLITDHLPIEEVEKVTVNQIISSLREDEIVFPYLAIKASDKRYDFRINFVDPSINKLQLHLISPQQLCVFEKGKDRIQLVGFAEPQEFAELLPIE